MPQDVAAALGSLPLNCDVELEYTQVEYTIDMALPCIKLAVEADGPLHFMRNVPKAIGRTLGKFVQRCVFHHSLHKAQLSSSFIQLHLAYIYSCSQPVACIWGQACAFIYSVSCLYLEPGMSLHMFSLLSLARARHVQSRNTVKAQYQLA